MSEFLPAELSMHDAAEAVSRCGFFNLNHPQVLVQFLVARDLGVPATTALSNVHIVKGKPVLSANLMRALVKQSGRYDYRVVENTDQRCEIRWLTTSGDELGTSSFSMADAKRAGLTTNPTWSKYPAAMLLARATGIGVRTHCPDVLMGSVYVEGELDDPEPVRVERVERPAPQPKPVAHSTPAPSEPTKVVTATLEDAQGEPVKPYTQAEASIRDEIMALLERCPEGVAEKGRDGLRRAVGADQLEKLLGWARRQAASAAEKGGAA